MHGTVVRPVRKRTAIYGLLAAVSLAGVALGVRAASQPTTPRVKGQHATRQVTPQSPVVIKARTGGRLWHFAAIATPSTDVRLLLFNLTAARVGVWLRITGKSSVDFEHVLVPPNGASVIPLSSLTHGNAAGALLLRADGNVVPARMVAAARGFKLAFALRGRPAHDTRAVPMPAKRWHFPALSMPVDVVLVALYNPNRFPVHATLRFAGSTHGGAVHMAIPSRTSKEMSFSASRDSGITQGMTVIASGDIVPQRTGVSAGLARSAYGVPGV